MKCRQNRRGGRGLQKIGGLRTLCQLFFMSQTIFCNTEATLQVLKKRCSENVQQIYRRTTCRSVISVKLLRYDCSPVNFLHIFRTPFLKINFGGLPLAIIFLFKKKNVSFPRHLDSFVLFIYLFIFI